MNPLIEQKSTSRSFRVRSLIVCSSYSHETEMMQSFRTRITVLVMPRCSTGVESTSVQSAGSLRTLSEIEEN
jgi:hypothetical protein